MKKIILSAYSCSPDRGSEPGNGWSWAINLAKLGYNVWCFTNIEDREKIELKCAQIALPNLNFVFISLPFSLDKLLFNKSSKGIYFHYLFWRKQAATEAIQYHKKINFDIAHHVTFGSLQQGTFLWRLKNIKLIFGPVGGGQEANKVFKQYFGDAWKFEVLRSTLSKLSFWFNSDLKNTLKYSSAILVTNKETELLIKNSSYYNPAKVHFLLDHAVPLSMEKIEYIDRDYNGALKLLWVGRVMPRKGLNLVLHALSFLPANIDYTFTIVGSGEQFSLIESWISQYNLDRNRINVIGHIPFTQVIEYYKVSHAFVFCSLRDSCPSQLTEAMAFGLPSIVLNIHGSALAVNDTCGIKVDVTTAVETAKSIADSIQYLYDNKPQLKFKSLNAFLLSKNNTWINKVKAVTDLYY